MHESAAVIAQRSAMHRLHAAVRTGNIPAIDEALAAGAKLNDSAAVELAILAGRPDILDHLIARGADVNRPGPDGELPIVTTLRRDRADLMQHLIDKGADVNLPDRRGMTALTHAQRLGRSDAVVLLRHKGAGDRETGAK